MVSLFRKYANWGMGGSRLSLEDFKAFWREQQRPQRPRGGGGGGAAGGDEQQQEAQLLQELEDEATAMFELAAYADLGRSDPRLADQRQQLLLTRSGPGSVQAGGRLG